MEKTSIYNYSRTLLEEIFTGMEEKSFHARQVISWVYKHHIFDFYKMTNISKSLQKKLDEQFNFALPKIASIQTSKDRTIKFLVELDNENYVETVLMPYDFGTSICISSQVGCNMGCAFCASGLKKKVRNLEVYEMIGQILLANEILKPMGKIVNNVVIMGTGEPFDNYKNVMDFIELISDSLGLGFGGRKITISTCGHVNNIKNFSLRQMQVNLAISLHATTDQIRDQLMPLNRVFPISSIVESIEFYHKYNNRKITIEYVLIDGVNDSDVDAERLRRLFAYCSGSILINLIPLNEVPEIPFKKSKRIHEFYSYLKKKHMNVTIRKEFGRDIDAACGQLRRKFGGCDTP